MHLEKNWSLRLFEGVQVRNLKDFVLIAALIAERFY